MAAFYTALTAWRLYNWWYIADLEPSWQFLKWIAIDATFFMGLPALQLPWLEFSPLATFSLWSLHAIMNAVLMYQLPIWAPLLAWLGGFIKPFFDSEISISEHRVKLASILQNDSIILGKQIIHILPEGSAFLNPGKQAFCLDSHTTSIDLPIQINQTTPILMELIRYDVETEEQDPIVLNQKQLRILKRNADKGFQRTETNTPRMLQYSVSKTGLYRLERVVDESQLEVRRRSYDVAVVKCPKASVSIPANDRCIGDLSGVSINVNGVPPFKVKYNKRINHQQFSSITQSIQGADADDTSNVLLDPARPQMGWTQSSSVYFEINEVLQRNGSWSYTVEEVEDGLGNKIFYDLNNDRSLSRDHRTNSVTVHNRPTANFAGCDSEHPLRVAAEDTISLPVRIHPPAQLHDSDWPLKLKYTFTPDVEGVPSVSEELFEMTSDRSLPRVSKAGTYNLESIGSQFCSGKVIEASSCTLYNPPRPALSIDKEDMFDKCAGNPIGMNVNLNFAGTPPFKVRYTVTHKGMASPKVLEFKNLRGQIELKEQNAGSYIYQFLEIEDDIYGPISLKKDNLVLSQDIKPPASAVFLEGRAIQKACLGQPIDLPVKLLGEGPWNLDYEIIHAGKRKKEHVYAEGDFHIIRVPSQTEGGEYSVILTGVEDKMKCRTSLKDERKVQVRPEQPRASFGDVDGQRSISALEGKDPKLPIRLKGVAPWTIEVKNLDDGSGLIEHRFKDANSLVPVNRPGTYEIVSVKDSCPGFVDPKANIFSVSWVARPKLSIKDPQAEPEGATTFRKAPICQGDDSSLALGLSGNAPFRVKLIQRLDPVKGPAAVSNKPLSFTSNNGLVPLDTARAGEYVYTFAEFSDERYAHSKQHFTPLTVKQQVYAPPTAKFTNPGKTYGYCKDDPSLTSSPPETETIPITLSGSPPFALELAIHHHGVSTRPEIMRVKDIQSTTYNYALSRSSLDLGTHALSLRSVKDSRGCQNIFESDPSSVRVSVSSPPQIIPLESKTDYCVGEHASFSLSGQAPFDIFYSFQNRERKAKISTNEFRRIAESPGQFVITGISDSVMGSGKCKARKELKKTINPYPSVEIGRGKTLISDIHEGGEVDIVFDFTGTPPFEFTYTRSETVKKGGGRVLETRSEKSNDFRKVVRASDEGTYEVVAIKDKHCAYAKDGGKPSAGKQKLLTY